LLKRLFDDEHGPNCDGRPMIVAAIDRVAMIVGIFAYPGRLHASRRVPGY
jgi:hypothetical protein